MASLSIEIVGCTAVFYRGFEPREAHSGNSRSIRKWIDNQLDLVGKCRIDGWHALQVLEEQEEAAAILEEARQSSANKASAKPPKLAKIVG